MSHTRGLVDIATAIMHANGVATDVIRPVDQDPAYGVCPDMTERGWDHDDWPEVLRLPESRLPVAGPV